LIDNEQFKKASNPINESPQIIASVKEEVSIVSEQPEKYAAKIEEIIVHIIPKIEVKAEIEKQDYKYLGDNNKYILIIVNEANFEFLNKNDLAFLTKILGAKKLEINDVAIINLTKYPSLDFTELKSFFGFSKLLTFGINPKILNVEGSVANKKFNYKNVDILGTWDLSKLEEDVKKKTIFWNELKTF
jgi:hypothetical protein